jgi:SAM-dependent methyltransferase
MTTSPQEPALDLARRAAPHTLPEWMDEPCSYEDFRACLVDLAHCNTLTLAARPTLDFLDRVVASLAAGQPSQPVARPPLRIVDVGYGGGDMLRRIARWADRRGQPVELVGIDLNPHAARAAASFTPPALAGRIRYITGDAFAHTEPVDVVLSSLFTHHLEDEEIVRFLAWSQRTAAMGWFINDLCREQLPFRLFPLLARALGWHRFVVHDGPVSFRRGFREADWTHLIMQARLPLDQVHMQRWKPARLCVEHLHSQP